MGNYRRKSPLSTGNADLTNNTTMISSNPQRKITNRSKDTLLSMALVAATISILTPPTPGHVPRNMHFVSAARHEPSALFCHYFPQQKSSLSTKSLLFHPSLLPDHGAIKHGQNNNYHCRNRSGHNRLHALDTSLPPPRGIPALQGEKSDDGTMTNHPNNILNNIPKEHAILETTSSSGIVSHGDGHSNVVLHSSSGLEATMPLQQGGSGGALISSIREEQESVKQSSNRDEQVLVGGALMFFALAVASVLKLSPPGCWRYYLAGGICASTSHALTTPIDVVKTRQQVDPWLEEKSMLEATLAIVKQGGPFALLAGLGPTALGYLIEGAVKFGIYEVSKPATLRFVASMASFFAVPALDSKILSLILCGLISGAAASIMLSPMEALRIRMVSDAEFSEMSSIKAFTKMVHGEGVQSVTKGLPAMMFKQVPYTITKNVSFDLFTTWAYRLWREMGYAITSNVKFAIPLVSAMSAAVLSCISSHPGDMLLSLVNAHEGEKRTRDFAKDIWKGKSGISGFFVGIKPRFVHVLVIVTVQLLIYDFVKRVVGIAATGM